MLTCLPHQPQGTITGFLPGFLRAAPNTLAASAVVMLSRLTGPSLAQDRKGVKIFLDRPAYFWQNWG